MSEIAAVRPDLSARPFSVVAERDMAVPPPAVFKAWTEQFDTWFAAPGTLIMEARVNAPYFFETRFEGQRHPHYGRFLTLEPDRLAEMTWVNAEGTHGFETVVTVELTAAENGTHVRLIHSGFPDETLASRHGEAWPRVLDHLEQVLRASI